MNFLISNKHLRKCSLKQRYILHIIETWLIGGTLGIAAVLIPIIIKEPHFLHHLIQALTP